MPRQTTDAEMIALKALLEPRKMQPKMMTRTVVRMSAFRGRSRRLWTLAKNLEKGTPLSLRGIRVFVEQRKELYVPSKGHGHPRARRHDGYGCEE